MEMWLWISVEDPTELAISKTQLTFNPTNYMNTQNWSVTGVDDALDDGNITSKVTISINGAGTTDTTGYASLSNKSKNITTVDDDSAPVLNSVTAGIQQNNLSWTTFPNEAGYRIYWSTSSPVTTSDNLIDNISGTVQQVISILAEQQEPLITMLIAYNCCWIFFFIK